ncbi:MAG: bifunctional oligoribonuclease/PAP phosphatase NrnA [Bacteroidetes bacterium]|nr:bifunctional oligoribonuclease/PAP phosphatase NrnA [Bacteroidota bacterium]
MLDFTSLLEIIKKNNTFLISTHVNPDADALGSEIAMLKILKHHKKEVKVVNHSSTPYNLEFLDENSLIEKYEPEFHDEYILTADVIIVVDLNHLSRIVSMERVVRESNANKVCIDHHLNPENFTEHFFAGDEFSSTGEIIFDLIKEHNFVPMDLEIANSLYAAIMTDTGSFRFDRTTPKIHKIAAELLEAGVVPHEIHDKIFSQNNFGRQKLLGYALSSLQLNDTKEICYMVLRSKDLENNGAIESDLDGFVNYCLGIEKVKIGLMFFELPDGVKISMRSKGKIPVNELAGEFDGGGHLNAAGARIFDVKLDDYLEKVLVTAEKYLKY